MRIGIAGTKQAGMKSVLMAGLIGILMLSGSPGGMTALASPRHQEADDASGLPTILLFIPRAGNAKFSLKNDPNAAMRVTVRDALRESGRYHVLSFQANDPIVVRALREHLLAAADTVEPISPEAMQRIAKAFGAKTLLALDVTLAHDALTTQWRLQEAVGPETWRTAYEEKTATEMAAGRKRLKFDAVIALAADPILTRLGLPSHSDQSLRTEKPILLNKPTKQEKAALARAEAERIALAKAKAKADKEKAARAAQTDTAANGSAAADGNTVNGTNSASTVSPTNQTDTGIAAIPKANGIKPKPSTKQKDTAKQTDDGAGTPAKQNKPAVPAIPKSDNSTFSAFSTDGAAGRNVTPVRPDVAPPPALAAPDMDAAISRYRQAGDTANVIASLRRAINLRPRDTLLRRQLIQAYSDRQMNDAALEETNRALLLLPDDASLHRLQGSAMLAKGNLPDALQAYRDAIKLDPADVQSQVALADALLTDGQFAEAQAAYQAAVKADPKSPLPHRRLANALARRAVGDSMLYAASLDELKQARALTPPADTAAYFEDYSGLARLMEARLRDLLNELQNDYQANQQGKLTGNALKTALADLKARSESAADYLDKLPPASGHDVTHAHYQQGAALLLQAVSLFRDYAAKPEEATLNAMKGAQTDAHRELTAGAKSLLGASQDLSTK